MKKFLSSVLAAVMLMTAFTLTLGMSVSAASKSIDLCELNKGEKGGFVDNKPSGKLEVTELDGKKVLKFTVDKSAEYANLMVNIEGHGYQKLGATYDTYRYMSVEYKYISKNPVYKGAFTAQLCNSNKVFQGGAMGVNGTALTASGEWETAYFDLTSYVDGKLATDKTSHPINHIQLRPFGGTPGNALDEDDVLYIGKVTFSEENLQPGGSTKPPVETEITEADKTPAATETPDTLGTDKKSAEPKVVGEGALFADAVKLLSGTVDKKDTGTFEKVTVDGRELVKFTPNPNGTDKGSQVAFECSGIGSALGKSIYYEDYNFITVEYFYAAKEPTYDKGMIVYLANSTKVFQSSGANLDSQPIKSGEWDVAYFQITDKIKSTLKTDMDQHILNHIHVRPFGSSSAQSLKKEDVIYIGKIGFHKENPNPKEEYKLTYGKNGVGVAGDEIPVATVAKDASVTLPECPWVYDGFRFAGWSINKKIYQPGESFKAEGDYDFEIFAVWHENADADINTKYAFYSDVNNGVVDSMGSLKYEKGADENGLPYVKAIPVPEYKKDGKSLTMPLENYGVGNKLKLDLDEYKYLSVTYKYESQNPLLDVVGVPVLSLTRNGGMFNNTGMRLVPIENAVVRPNEWTTVLYEFPALGELYVNPDQQHILQQFHLQPFGAIMNSAVTKDDVAYVQSITYHKEKPEKVKLEMPYITGFEDGSFGLGQTMTRAQACTVVARLLAGSDANVTAGASAFSDVTANDWFAKYVAYCEAKGLLKSYSGTFLPNQAITRAEFVELVYNMGLLADKGLNGTFTDVAQDHPRAAVISAAGKAGLVNGYANGDGTFCFKPDATISREEVVTVINNAYSRKSDKEFLATNGYGAYYTDVNAEHWAFPAIIDASVVHLACREAAAETDTWLYVGGVAAKFTEESYAAAAAKLAEVDTLTAKRIDEIRNTKTAVEVTGTRYYFANDGDDANDGLSPEKPKKTLEAVNGLLLNPGDGVFFKRGDTFRGQVRAKRGVTYSAYGEGEKPKLYASPANFAGAENWEETEVKNVWKLKTIITHDVGLVVFNEGEAWTEKRIKGRTEFKDGGLENLDVDLAMWHDVPAPTNAAGFVYVRCDKGNPGAIYNSIELNPRSGIFIASTDDITIDNLCMKYTGAHAVSSGGVKNLVVTNCEFGFIGGSWFRTDTLSRYGNAVEIYGAVDGYVVDNCYIYHCYDAGVTHQLTQSPDTECIMADVHYTNNVITHTSYPVEYFIHKPDDGVTHAYIGLEISNNIIRETGYGFGDQRPDKTAAAAIKSWNSYNAAENYVMNNNIFDRSKYMLMQLGADSDAWLPEMNGNIYIIEEGANFGNVGNVSATTATVTLPEYIRRNSKDENCEVYVLKKAE